MKYSPTEINNNIKKYDFNFKKKFGQNFIADENIIDNIIREAKMDEDTLVIEVGPGAGALTYKLSKNAGAVLCYEIDTTLKDMLANNLKDCDNVEVIYQDFLKADVLTDINKYNYKNLYLIANLPYYITTPIIMKIIDDCIDVDKMLVMVQKEVGDRFNAKPNTKNYNSLSVFLQYNYNIRKALDVSRNVFVPKPNVDSVVIEFSKKERIPVKNINLFYRLVKDSFVQKRKTLRNNLKTYDLAKIEEVLRKYNFDLSARAEQLSIDIFIDISNNL